MSKLEENNHFLKEQILTYIGNKRTLLEDIENEVLEIIPHLGRKPIIFDVFSGSGIVARMLKKYSSHIITNDLEKYSYIINKAYLSNKSEFDEEQFDKCLNEVREVISKQEFSPMIISELYSPHNDKDIKKGERVFYTNKNALIIDTVRRMIDDMPDSVKNFFLAQLLIESSIHVNTSGVFKGFYKDSKTGIGKFGGNGENALSRIKSDITFKRPVLSDYESQYSVYQEDSNELAKRIKDIDIAYVDPPYNQHPYGSNYFLLNIIVDNELTAPSVSPISGIPVDWNRSQYNKKQKIYDTFKDLISSLSAKYIIVSYNSEGFLSFDEILEILKEFGEVKEKKIRYNTFKGSRNLKERSIHINEYLFVLKKNIKKI